MVDVSADDSGAARDGALPKNLSLMQKRFLFMLEFVDEFYKILVVSFVNSFHFDYQ